jgi:pimeloyl-ACP methyl ester carboxylesterase
LPLARAVRRAGAGAQLFGYAAALESVDRIVERLAGRITRMASDPYIVVGHSLGGVLLRMALARLPEGTCQPALLVLLAAPHQAPRLARRLHRSLPYRLLNGQAGQLLGDEARMAAVPLPTAPCMVVVGTGGPRARWTSFPDEPNDGIVAVSEALLGCGEEVLSLERGHTFLMNARELHQRLLRAIAE